MLLCVLAYIVTYFVMHHIATYRQHSRLGRRLRDAIQLVMALGFLPTAVVRQTLHQFMTTNRVTRLIRTLPGFGTWLTYVRQIYVNQGATFPVAIWNVFDRTIDTRTNNTVERLLQFLLVTSQVLQVY